MKKSFTIITLLILLATTGLAMGESPTTPLTLEGLQSKVNNKLLQMDQDTALAAQELALPKLAKDQSKIINQLYRKHTSIIDCAIIDINGKISFIEPKKYQSSEGLMVSQPDQLLKIKETQKPIFSNLFKAAEGFYAVSLAYPILTEEKEIKGFLSVVLQPDALIRKNLLSFKSDKSVEVLAIQTDGRIIYDKDILQVGKMTFSDPSYQSYSSLLELAKRITQEASGQGNYEFTKQGETTTSEKVSAWTTISLHNTSWRLIISK